MKIDSLSSLSTELGIGQSLQAPGKASEVGKSELGNFDDVLLKGMQKVNEDLLKSSKMSEEHLTQGKHELHEVMIQMETADLNFRFMTQVRNKVLDAYNEIMRMQV